MYADLAGQDALPRPSPPSFGWPVSGGDIACSAPNVETAALGVVSHREIARRTRASLGSPTVTTW